VLRYTDTPPAPSVGNFKRQRANLAWDLNEASRAIICDDGDGGMFVIEEEARRAEKRVKTVLDALKKVDAEDQPLRRRASPTN
jgi:hypothetical protein